jgi:hypothetical protein
MTHFSSNKKYLELTHLVHLFISSHYKQVDPKIPPQR